MQHANLGPGSSTTGVVPRHGSDEPAATRWFAPALAMQSLGKSRIRVRNSLNDKALVLSSGECAVLAACTGCRTLDEHEAEVAESLDAPPEHRPAIRECLELCARVGLLTSFSDLVARCGPADGSPLPPLGAVTIRTADRPAMLERLLASALNLRARTGVSYPWHVVDDSRSTDNRSANHETLARHSELEVTYHDLRDPVSLEIELKCSFPRLSEEIGWLLGAARGNEATYGRPMNYTLLRFAGHRLLVIDDDTTLEARCSPVNGHDFAVARMGDELRWYANLDAAVADCPQLDLDPLAEHARWLGLPLAQAWPHVLRDSTRLGPTELTPNCGARFRPEARVLFTHNHALGDPGWAGFPFKEFSLPAASRRWLAAHPDTVPFAFHTAFNWRGVSGLQLVPDGDLSTTTVGGIDNRQLLPPTARATRGEDVLLGRAGGIVCPWAWSADLPFALPHLRATPRRRLTPLDRGPPEPIQFLIEYARGRSGTFVADTAESRTAALGALYLELGAASHAKLTELIQEQLAGSTAWLVSNINQQLDDEALPAAWKDALRGWLDSPHLQLDSASLHANMAAPAIVRAMAIDYGKALIAWPQLWEYCRERYANGG
jgi:hypothetical protein